MAQEVTGPIFVIGNARSGTHWLAYALEAHPGVRATIEALPMFELSIRIALNPMLEEQLLRTLVQAYRQQLSKFAPRLYLDKSHPNIWFAEKLKEVFPQSLFVGIEREPYATIASMLRHKGVLEWHRCWREFPVPSRFLGITAELVATYDSIPLASQCAIRWAAHRDKMSELRAALGDSLLVVSYESFAHETGRVLLELQQFLGLGSAIPMPEVKTDSLHKWRRQLSNKEIEQIHSIVGEEVVG